MKKVKTLGLIGLALASVAMLCVADEGGKKKRILFFSPSFGYRHSVVTRPLTGELSFAEKMIKEMGAKAGYEVSVSQDCNDLKSPEQFNKFDAIIFYTTQSPTINREAFVKWLQAGHAFIGVHCATDSFYDSPDYNRIIGAQFKTHSMNDKPVTLKNEKPDHVTTKHLGAECEFTDEIYQFKDETLQKDHLDFLLSIDTKKTDIKAQKMQDGHYYPISWTNTEGKGRVFYTALGHREDIWTNPKFQQHLMSGIAWALQAEDAK